MTTDFQVAWIRDCTAQDLAKKLVSYCYVSGEVAGEDPKCKCLVHQARKAAKADEIERNAVHGEATALVAAQAAEQEVIKLKTELLNSHKQISAFGKRTNEAEAAQAAMVADLDAAIRGRSGAQQEVADLQGRLRLAKEAEAAAVIKLTSIIATIKGVL